MNSQGFFGQSSLPLNTVIYVDVLLPLALPQLLTYSVPTELQNQLLVGIRVTVQLRDKKLYSAIVADIHQNAPKNFTAKDIINIIDDHAIVSTQQLQFWKWISEYYMCTLGEVMKAALPAALKMESETKISATQSNIIPTELSTVEQLIISELNKKACNIYELNQRLGQKNVLPLLKNLLDKNLLSIDEELKNNYRHKTKSFVALHPNIQNDQQLHNLLSELDRAPKQKKLLLTYLHLAEPLSYVCPVEIPKDELMKVGEGTPASFKACLEKNIFKKIDKQVERINNTATVQKSLPELSKAQEKAIDEIRSLFESSNSVLLHGITSSGKTEVYIQLINEQLEQNRQVLYLLPEIALTTQIIERLQQVFGNKVGIYHSRFSDAERVEIYKRLLQLHNEPDKAYVILGARSSIFLPFTQLGLIIVDEEHESSYKQYDPAPRYNARDAAIVLASLHQAKTLLGSATPSVESYNNARNAKYGLVELTERYGNAQLPKIEIVDMVRARKKKLVHSHFSKVLLDAINTALERKEQVILFQNRRGFSSFIQCQACGHVPHCVHCDVSLTYHKYNQQLTCHYCGYATAMPTHCDKCASTEVTACGFGTEKIEDELSVLLPHAKIERWDLDSTRAKNAYERILHNFETQVTNILVGTQMIAKGLDFGNVSLVGILNADNMLNFPDFRAYERSFQLMSQVAGRAGRKSKDGFVIIQTSNPENPVLDQVIRNDYLTLYLGQAKERKLFFYPPYSRLIIITLKHTKREIVHQAANQLKGTLVMIFNKQLAGPEPPAINRIQNKYLLVFRLKLKRDDKLIHYKTLLNHCLSTLILSNRAYASLQISIDVDPA